MDLHALGKMALDTLAEVVYKPRGEKSEDAFAYSVERDDLHLQAVFDGCGGAGSWKYAEYQNATGAFISAQSIAKECLNWFRTITPEVGVDPKQLGESFRNMADRKLTELRSHCAPMKVSGSLVKAFPCTASLAVIHPEKDSISLNTVNIGDSRVYFLTPQNGLVQITSDDTVGNPDPMQNLRESAPLSDMLNADQPFTIKSRQLTLSFPCAILCASDGIFGYFRSPMDFEFILLAALMNSSCFAQFEEALKTEIAKATGDDSTCLMSFYGWGSYETVRKMLAERYKQVMTMIRALDDAEAHDTLEEALTQTWKEYRKQTIFDEMKR